MLAGITKKEVRQAPLRGLRGESLMRQRAEERQGPKTQERERLKFKL